jgi:hypothetical protein
MMFISDATNKNMIMIIIDGVFMRFFMIFIELSITT